LNRDGQEFLNRLANFPVHSFESRFSSISTRIGVGRALHLTEVHLLYEAAFAAVLCNIALNGLGGCNGRIKPQRERNRIRLELEFMEARGRLLGSPGWQALSASEKETIRRIFLSVRVDEDKLAW
jgi:hypothetical protein